MSTKVFSPPVSAAPDTGQFIVGAAIGSGGAARAAEHGGADFLLVLTAGRFRIRGAASAACMFALDDANTLAQDLVEHEIAPMCRGPIFLGLSAMNPKDDLEAMVTASASLGCAGIMNFPTAAHYPAYIREALDRAGIGFTRELALLARAREAGLEAIAHVTTAEQAEEAARIGVDAICLNYGWNTGGDTGARSQISLSEASVIAAEVRRRIRKINREARLLLEGGPIETSSDLMTVLEASRADGYIGGSTIDRLPMETGTANQVLSFKNTVLALSRQAHQKSNRLKTLELVGLYGTSRAMVNLADNIAALAKSGGPALAIGEEGSGRQRVLEAIAMQRGHSLSSVLTLNTDTLTPTQVQNRLFGTTKPPAQFGLQAIEQKYLILRDLADLPKPIQRRIAKYLETGTYTMQGTRRQHTSTVELLFLSRLSLAEMRERGMIIDRLAELLARAEIITPPLRTRPEDVDIVLTEMMRSIDPDRKPPTLSPLAMRHLRTYYWPGNLTEVRSVAQELLSKSDDTQLTEADVVRGLSSRKITRADKILSERQLILDALWRHGFNRTKTAVFLNISRKTLYNKIHKYRLTDTR